MPPENKQLELEQRVNGLQQRVEELSRERQQQLTYPLDPNSREVLKDALPRITTEHMFDILLKDIFYWYTPFEQMFDGPWQILEIGTGGIAEIADGEHFQLTTGSTSGDAIGATKRILVSNEEVYRKRSKFITAFEVPAITSQEAFLVWGTSNIAGGSSSASVGFRINNATLQGVAHDGTTQKTVDLLTIVANTLYRLELVYRPNRSVRFVVNDVDRGSIQDNLPSASTTEEMFMDFAIKTNTSATRTLFTKYAGIVQLT